MHILCAFYVLFTEFPVKTVVFKVPFGRQCKFDEGFSSFHLVVYQRCTSPVFAVVIYSNCYILLKQNRFLFCCLVKHCAK